MSRINSDESSAIDEYKSIITMRMLLYRIIGDALKPYHEEDLNDLFMILTRIPKDTATILAESLMIPSFKDFYETWLTSMREERSALVKKLKQKIGPKAKCSLDNYKESIDSIGKNIARLASIEVEEKENVNLIGLIELVYTLLGMEYSALEEYNITPLIALETEFILSKIVPSFVNLARCLEEGEDEKTVKSLAMLLSEFSLVEKSVAEAQQKALLTASRQQGSS